MIERTVERNGALYVDIEVGMPLTGPANLAETPLLMLLGDIRWKHIQHYTGVGSKDLVDESGQRVYATFFYVEIQFPPETPMAAYGENDRFTIVNTLRIYEEASADGYHFLYPADWPEWRKLPLVDGEAARKLGIPFVRTCNTFVQMVQGASWLKKALPVQLGTAACPTVPGTAEPYGLILRVSQERGFREPPWGYSALTPGPVGLTYEPDPDRDLNGVGLLYFANYPRILDVAERRLLSTTAAVSIPDRVLDGRTIIHRELAYLCNILPSDAIDVYVEPWIENPLLLPSRRSDSHPIRLFLNYEMYRHSDGRKMLVSTAEKVIHGRTVADAGLLPALESLAASARVG